ncbi:MAG: metal-dependent transcriptional regulator [Bacteroidetes bacterium]|nr:metal-dependent transcriptional regulator [Bacteroidota bacterium]MCH8524329.1 metal-dependent transcriptional regulator [Balneolales bacterium]
MSEIHRNKLSESQEDYLKKIYVLGEVEPQVSTQALADHLKVKPASVTGMLKKLSELGLVSYERYKGVQLTPAGERIAVEILRHHRLIEMYLSQVLGYSWDEIHDEAERLEHHISEKFEAKIAEKLGHPTHDPHGDPIPLADLTFPDQPALQVLMDIPANTKVVIKRVRTQDSDILTLMSKLGLTLEKELTVLSRDADGVRIQLGNDRMLVPADIAQKINVGVY